ncbi:MAG: hypothetical protein ACRDWN_08645, partial [Acidimicrobiales bacterium]
IGVYVFPIIKADFGVNGALRLSALFALLGLGLTLLIPEPARRSLDELSPEEVLAGAEEIVATAEAEGLEVPVTPTFEQHDDPVETIEPEVTVTRR